MDVRDVGAELHRLADAEELAPFDTGTVLRRGRRGRRRRKLFAAGGTVLGVAAIALASGVLPDLRVADGGPGVAGVGPDAVRTNSSFEPVPGVPGGEDGAGQKLTKEEAERRCALRYPQYTRPLERAVWAAGRTVAYEFQAGAKFQECTIPGGDRPSAALVREAKADPMPTTTAGQLRNCSVHLWVDLTNWRVTASDRAEGFAQSLVAVSPSGRKAVSCYLEPTWGDQVMPRRSSSMFLSLDSLSASDPVVTTTRPEYAEVRLGSSGRASCPGAPCPGWYALEFGRVAPNITRVRIVLQGHGAHDVAVKDGWYTIAWVHRGFKGSNPKYTITGYDRAGTAIKVIGEN